MEEKKSDYVKMIRKCVGHAPIMLCAAGVLIINDNRQVMLQLRADNHFWGIPGGAMELGETLEETARREVLEETGIIINNPKFFSLFSGENQHFLYPNKDEVYYVIAVYIVTDYSGEISPNPEESEDVKFFDVENLPQNINPTDRPVIKEFLDKFSADEIAL